MRARPGAARAFVDGRFVDASTAAVPITDRGFLYGDAVFETLRTYRGVPFLLERHLDRMFASCRELGIAPRGGRNGIRRALLQLVRSVGADDCYLRVAVTRGSGMGPWPKRLDARGRVVMFCRPLRVAPRRSGAVGLRLVTARVRRQPGSALVRHKTACYLESVLARREAAAAGADEALMLNSAGRVAELSAANIFIVRGGRLATPPPSEGLLPGVTRKLVIELARKAGLRCRERALRPAEVRAADECFATNSLVEVCPVASLDGRRIGGMAPGPVTAALQAAYRAEVHRRCRPSAR